MPAATTLLADFTARLRAVDGSVDVSAGVAATRDRISRLCAESGGTVVATRAAADYVPATADLAGGTATIATAAVGVSRAVLGVAETGSVLLAPASRRDRLVGLLPPLHIVVLDLAALHPSLDDAATAMRAAVADGVAYLSLVTGPSRTADVERVITVGAHGPRLVHVMLVEDAP